MIGATGAVGGEVVRTLLTFPELERLTLLGRRPVAGVNHPALRQETVDLGNPQSYAPLLAGHAAAVCTLGVGEPSAVNRDHFHRVDYQMPLDFARACRAAGVGHFTLLDSVGASAGSRNW